MTKKISVFLLSLVFALDLPVSCYAGKYLSPFCICTGTGILGTTVWTSSDGAGCGWHFF
mgnify:CR=1 FL=1